MSSRSYAVNALALPASYSEAVRAHWKEYLMEAAERALRLGDLAPTDADVSFAPYNLALSGGGL
jgi:hypothetical protein